MNKKGFIEIQFNWLFILVAGAIILLFFIALIYSQKASAAEKVNYQILTDLETIVTGANVASKTSYTIKLPSVEVTFKCPDCDCSYYVGEKLGVALKEKIVFAPSLIKGRQMITWSTEWEMPFFVTNFLFVTSPEARYIIVNSTGYGDIADKLFQKIPDTINKELVGTTDVVVDKNNYFTRIVRFGSDSPPAGWQLSGDVSEIWFSPNQGSLDFGTVRFGTGDELQLLGEATVYAAIFTQDEGMYKCNMAKAFRKLNLVSEIYRDRTLALASHSSLCKPMYQGSSFGVYSTAKYPDDAQSVVTGYNLLSASNYQLQLWSCPLLY